MEVVMLLMTYICVPSKTKDVKVCNMVTRINEAKTLVKHISYDCKCKLNSTTFNPNQKGIMIRVNANVKTIAHAKKFIVGIPTRVFVRIPSV